MSKVKTDNLEVYTNGSTLSVNSPFSVTAGNAMTCNGPLTSNNAAAFNGSGTSLTVNQGNMLAKSLIYVGPSTTSPGCTFNQDGSATVGTLTTGTTSVNGVLDMNSNSIVDVNAITCTSITVNGTAPLVANPVHAIAKMTVSSSSGSNALQGGRGFANSFTNSSSGSYSLVTLTLSNALPNSTNAVAIVTAIDNAAIPIAASITSTTTVQVKWANTLNSININVAVMI